MQKEIKQTWHFKQSPEDQTGINRTVADENKLTAYRGL